MGIPVKLDVFEGPLDLLLHLIEKNKVDIYDIPIVLITEQYMEYIQSIDTKDMDIMSEFLVMAAWLVSIKSKMLLPKEEDKKEEEDPREELVERLLEYKMYKYMSYELKDKLQDASRILYKPAGTPAWVADYKEEADPRELLDGLTLTKLYGVFKSVMRKQTDKIDPIRSKFGKIEKEEVKLDDKIEWIETYGKTHPVFSFRELLTKQSSKMEVIVTFLGVLELMKSGIIQIVQERIFDDIRITYADGGKEIGTK